MSRSPLFVELTKLRSEVTGLDTSRNADRVARYEMVAAMKAINAYVLDGEGSSLAAARERLRRVEVMVPASMRRNVERSIEQTLAAAAALSAEDRRALSREWTDLFGPGSRAEPVPVAEPDDEIQRAIGIMRRLSVGLERWVWRDPAAPGRGPTWEVENEAHVQSLLWLALAPSLPGLKFEETLPSVGRSHPRVDLALPLAGLAIEAKFLRQRGDFRRATEELAADSALYTSASSTSYSRLIAFVWDDTRATERHLQFAEGVSGLRGVIDVIVVSRPASMGRTTR